MGPPYVPMKRQGYPRYSSRIITQIKTACFGKPQKLFKIEKNFLTIFLDIVVVNAEGDFEDRRDEFFSTH